MDEGGAKPVCAQEALDLLNCVTQSPYDQDKCLTLLNSLRQCVLAKIPCSKEFMHSLYSANRNRWMKIRRRTFQLQQIRFKAGIWNKVKKFSLAGQEQQETKPSREKA